MKLYQKLLTKSYLKSFFIIFLALEIFFTGLDLMQNLKNLPDSANIKVLYAVNVFLRFVNYTLPLSLLFAMVNTVLNLIKSNQLVAIYALGNSKTAIIKPIFYTALFITLGYIALENTSFVESEDKSVSMRKYGTISDKTHDLFLKSNNNYVYIKELNPIKKSATNIKIFKIKNQKVINVIDAKEGNFSTNKWILKKVTHLRLVGHDYQELEQKQYEEMDALEGFEPKIINNVYKGDGKLTIADSLNAINFLESQSLNSEKVKASLYNMILFPLFVPIAILALFYPLPIQRRGANIALINTIYILLILLLWGVLFSLTRISLNGALSPTLALLLPLVLLLSLALYSVYKNR